MNTDLQAALTQALLSHDKVWADEEKTILAKKFCWIWWKKLTRSLLVCY